MQKCNIGLTNVLISLYDTNFFTPTKEFKQKTKSEFLQTLCASFSPSNPHDACRFRENCIFDTNTDNKRQMSTVDLFCRQEIEAAALDLTLRKEGTQLPLQQVPFHPGVRRADNDLPHLLPLLQCYAGHNLRQPQQKAMLDAWQKRYISFEKIQQEQLQHDTYGEILLAFINAPSTQWKKAWVKKYELLPSLVLALKSKNDNEQSKIILPQNCALTIMCAVQTFVVSRKSYRYLSKVFIGLILCAA